MGDSRRWRVSRLSRSSLILCPCVPWEIARGTITGARFNHAGTPDGFAGPWWRENSGCSSAFPYSGEVEPGASRMVLVEELQQRPCDGRHVLVPVLDHGDYKLRQFGRVICRVERVVVEREEHYR